MLNILQSEFNLIIQVKKYNLFSKGQLFVKMSRNVLFLSLCVGLFAYLTSICYHLQLSVCIHFIISQVHMTSC